VAGAREPRPVRAVDQASRAAVVASGLPRAGSSGGVPLKIKDFIGTVGLLDWAKENGCPWVARTCAEIAPHGHLHVLRRARELDCLWDESTCAAAAEAARGLHSFAFRLNINTFCGLRWVYGWSQ
jgi:hypothetical protein